MCIWDLACTRLDPMFKGALNHHHIDSTDTGTGYKITQLLQICQQHMQISWSTTPKGVLLD